VRADTSSVLYGTVPELASACAERAFAIFYTGTIGGGDAGLIEGTHARRARHDGAAVDARIGIHENWTARRHRVTVLSHSRPGSGRAPQPRMPVEDPVMSARLTKMLLMLPLCAVLASVQAISVRAQRADDPDCYNKCMRNYGCGPGFPRGPNDISCREFGRECRQACTRR
jgi:hypothetical protein